MGKQSVWTKTTTLLSRGVVAAALLVGAASSSWTVPLQAQSGTIVLTPTVGVTPPLTIVTVNDGPEVQLFPHVGGDLVSYSDTHYENDRLPLKYFRFSTGVTSQIPLGDAIADYWPDIDDGRITFTRFFSDRDAIMLFDTSTSALNEILPAAGSARQMSGIGGNTLAFVDLRKTDGSFGSGDIVAYDLTSALSTRLTASIDTFNEFPSVSHDGQTIVWTNCTPGLVPGGELIPCGTMAAVWDNSVAAWSVKTISPTPAHGSEIADTDGTWITYSYSPSASPTEEDVYFVPVAGGPARRLALAGQQAYPSISRGVISFTSYEDWAHGSIFLYVIATNTLYQVTSPHNLGLSGVDVLDSGAIRLAWSSADNDAPESGLNVYATTFRVPLTTTSQTCLLYDPALVKKRGSAFPIKVQL